ncbi:MAG: CoA pyrophosphatase [Pseudomonadota bacterium]|nr:CoA pyrophosphatase [Pseudomonadota bacterium]
MPTFTPQTSVKDDSTKYYSVIDGVKYRNSAVLVPLVEKSNGTEIILTIRSNDLPSHAGQISFPGGKVDAEDKNPVDTAYREAFEEIGLSEKHIKRLGYLDITTTGTNYMILPVVGLIDIDFLPKINRNEVEDIIYLPLEFIEHKNNLKYVDKEFNGIRKSFYLYQYKEYSIWGATARILKTLSERFFQ